MVPADDIEAIKRRNEEMQRRLQEELARLKPTEIPPPPSAFANAIDAALSSTPLDQLTPDFGVPIMSEETPITAAPSVAETTVPSAPAEFSFKELEEETVTINPTIPEEFGIPSTPFFPEATATTTQIPTTTSRSDEDFFADLPSAWGTTVPPVEEKPTEPVPSTVEPVIAATPAEPEETTIPQIEPVTAEVSEAQPEPVFGWEPTFNETEVKPEFKIPEVEEEFITASVEIIPEPEEPVIEQPVEPIKPQIGELTRVIVALDQGRLRWGRVGMQTEEEAIELLERAVAIYRLKHPKP